MEDTKKTFYITTAIHYANAGPHLGHAYEGVLADILARYHRKKSEETFFLSGTDEHGQKIVRGSDTAGLSPQAFVDGNTEKFKDLYDKLSLSNDLFIRTSDQKKHWPGAQALWRIFNEKGDIYKDTYEGLYCVGCERFVSEHDLEEGKCPDHNAVPEKVKEENYFFRISKYQEQVREVIEGGKIQIFPASRKAEVLGLLKKPLEDLSFSRPEGTVPWGVPVPDDESQMMYVWCDALSNYITALDYGREDATNYEKFWPADVHVIGKDILRFHAIYWPAMLLSAELPLPKTLLIHGHIISGGKKMSKTLGNVIDPNEYIEEFGSEAFRYYLGREISPFSDGDFTKEKFIASYNGNLANGIGNLVSRTFAMAQKYFDGKVDRPEGRSVPILRNPVAFGEETPTYQIPHHFKHFVLPEYGKHMESFSVNEAAGTLWDFASILDAYISDYEPYKLIKTDEEKTRAVLWNALYGIYSLSLLLDPFMPETAEKILSALGVSGGENDSEDIVFDVSPLSGPLFKKIETTNDQTSG